MTEEEIQKNSEHWYNKYKDAEKRIAELELELTVEKDQHQEEINLHLHAEEYIKSLEQENAKLESEFRICEQNADTYYDQLTIAKDLIHQFLIQNPISDWLPKKAEQFLKESE